MGGPWPRTRFAKSERLSRSAVAQQAKEIGSDPLLEGLLDHISEPAAVLGELGQIVFANWAFLRLAHELERGTVIGSRVGEALHCVHAGRNSESCGTSPFCERCGALQAILRAMGGQESVRDCSILRHNDEPVEVAVRAAPMEVGGHRYTLFSFLDKSQENRRRALERIFFHDILNAASSLHGHADLILHNTLSREQVEECAGAIRQISATILEELRAQKDLASAEAHELVPLPGPIESLSVLTRLAASYRGLNAARNRPIRVEEGSASVVLTTDLALLRRVLGNMVKNALEASHPYQTVTLSCRLAGHGVVYEVHNEGAIPRDVQVQIFLRMFSTHGEPGRGLGTYSIKLLGENYLHGHVSFKSNPVHGTTFRIWLPREWPEREPLQG